MFDRLNRRDVVTGLGAAAVWPLIARAQQAIPMIGVLGSDSHEMGGARYAAFKQALAETGYVEGGNVSFEYRWSTAFQSSRPSWCVVR